MRRIIILAALIGGVCAWPDVGSDFIQAYGRIVRVHGSCEPRFHRLWDALAQAVGLRFG